MGKGKRNRGVRSLPGKPVVGNPMLARMEARRKAEFDYEKSAETDILLQVCADAFLLACHEVFGMGAGRAEKALNAYRGKVMEIMDGIIQDGPKKDGNGDNDLAYFWEDLDRALLQTVGEKNFTPHEERYSGVGQRLLKRYAGDGGGQCPPLRTEVEKGV